MARNDGKWKAIIGFCKSPTPEAEATVFPGAKFFPFRDFPVGQKDSPQSPKDSLL